jgi:hypothetical protein
MAAADALLEKLFAFLNRLAQRRVMRLPADRALNLVGGIGRTAGPSAEDIAGRAQQTPGRSQHRVLERTEMAIAALIAMKFELVPAIRGKIVIIANELNHRHRK